jgi:hypothetical protein
VLPMSETLKSYVYIISSGSVWMGSYDVTSNILLILCLFTFSCYGKSIQNVDAYKDVFILDEAQFEREKQNPFYQGSSDLDGKYYECTFLKKKIMHNRNTAFGWHVYSYAKLMLLKFFYDFLRRYFHPRDFEPVLADTDSMYVAFSAKDWESLVWPDRREHYLANRHNWLPRRPEDAHLDSPDDPRDNRTPGLFHIEFEGDFICALNPKTYYAEGPDKDDPAKKIIKLSTKGCPKKINNFRKEQFLEVLESGKSVAGQVRNFRHNASGAFGRMNMHRTALSYLMIKRKVLEDGIHTVPLDI